MFKKYRVYLNKEQFHNDAKAGINWCFTVDIARDSFTRFYPEHS